MHDMMSCRAASYRVLRLKRRVTLRRVMSRRADGDLFDAVAPQVLRLLSVLRGASARAGEAFALRETPLTRQMGPGGGFLCALCAAVAFGAQYVPVKHYEIYDGITFQWLSGDLQAGPASRRGPLSCLGP